MFIGEKMKYVGIVGRLNCDKITFNNEVVKIINDYNCIPVGIIANFENDAYLEFNNLKELIDICDGFILQGGSQIYDIDILIVKYLYSKNLPTLGICLGMQTMGIAFNGVERRIGISHNSQEKYVHNIIINKNSKLYNIIGKEEIMVNSRHKDYIFSTDLDIVACSNIPEALENKNKKFFIGVQWHPESLHDENSNLLFDNFFNALN